MVEAFRKGITAQQNGDSIAVCPYVALAAFTAHGERWRPFIQAWRDGWFWAERRGVTE
ncbi:hypothetical protein [Acidithiobacillus caldus]|nr:hypothetical protein [Acidithiobacillus caldus]